MNEIAYPHIAERLFGRPLAIEPLALRAIMDGPLVRRVLAGAKIGGKHGKKGRDIRRDRLASIAQAEQVKTADGLVEYGLTSEGVAIVPVTGVLSRRFDWLAAACGWTTYDGLGATLDALGDDYRVKAILLDVDSPGGEADGMLDIGDAIIAARGVKGPVWAVANTLAASAAYAIAGSAERLYLPRIAQVGSIGCVTIHVDQSASDQAAGLSYTAIYSGARKIDGWGHAPLSDPARDSAQSSVDHVRAQFAALVGRQGRISVKAAMATEAAVYADQAAVDAGLADRVGTFNDALAALTEQVSPTRVFKGAAMTKKSDAAATVTNVTPTQPAALSEPNAVAAEAVIASKADMEPPEPGEKCKLCGQMYEPVEPDDDAKSQAVADAAVASQAASANYGEAEMRETLEVCALAKLPIGAAQDFIKAKTPVAKVRDTVIAQLAKAADSQQIERVATVGADGGQDATRMASWRDTQKKLKAELGIGKRD